MMAIAMAAAGESEGDVCVCVLGGTYPHTDREGSCSSLDVVEMVSQQEL